MTLINVGLELNSSLNYSLNNTSELFKQNIEFFIELFMNISKLLVYC